MSNPVVFEAFFMGRPDHVRLAIDHWQQAIGSVEGVSVDGQGEFLESGSWPFPVEFQVWRGPTLRFSVPGALDDSQISKKLSALMKKSVGSELTLLGWSAAALPDQKTLVSELVISLGCLPNESVGPQGRSALFRAWPLEFPLEVSSGNHLPFFQKCFANLVAAPTFQRLLTPMKALRLKEVLDASFLVAKSPSKRPRL